MNRSYYDLTNPLLPPPTAPGRLPREPTPIMSGAMPPHAQSQPRLQNYPERPSTPSPRDARGSMSLQVPASRQRPRSVPPVIDERRSRRRTSPSPSSSRSSSSSSASRARHRGPIGKVRHAVRDTFTDSPSGLGVGILGAVVGGLVAHEASNAASRRKHKAPRDEESHRTHSGKDKEKDHPSRALATIAGALVGGLGANAVERKFEEVRVRERERQEAWVKRWGKESDLPPHDRRGSGEGRRGDDEDEDDYVYDDRRRRRLSEDEYRRYRY